LFSAVVRLSRTVPLALAALVACAAFASTALAKPPPRCNGQRSLCARHFDDVVLPATHNSMSAASLGWDIPNQPNTIADQLRAGVRGLLIDTHYGRLQPDGTVLTDDDGSVTTGKLGLYLCHSLCQLGASPLVPQLTAIRKFLERSPDNVLLLDVEDYITPQDFAGAMERSGLLDHLYRGTTGPRWPTLRRMIRSHRQVVTLAEHDGANGVYPWLHLDYDGIVQETPYTFKTPDLLTKAANWPASCVPNRGGTTGSLFLMNHWSPPVPQSPPDPALARAVNAKDVLIGRARRCAKQRGLMPTIVAVDHYTEGGLFAAVRKLNALAG
jgi:hypothetical protein